MTDYGAWFVIYVPEEDGYWGFQGELHKIITFPADGASYGNSVAMFHQDEIDAAAHTFASNFRNTAGDILSVIVVELCQPNTNVYKYFPDFTRSFTMEL